MRNQHWRKEETKKRGRVYITGINLCLFWDPLDINTDI